MRHFFISILIISFYTTYSQETLTTLSLPARINDLRGMIVGDDIFLSIELPPVNAKPNIISYFIHPDGSKTAINFKNIPEKLMIAGVREGDDAYFYYLDEVSKQAVIKCTVVDKSGTGRALPETIDVPGKIYGAYIERGDLFMLCALKKEFTLKLLRIHHGSLVEETSFALPVDLGKKKQAKVSFIDASIPTTPKQASAPIKLVKDKNLIWIIVDEPFYEFDQNLTESSVFKTTVVKLDLLMGSTSIKSFMETQRSPFTSAIHNGDLYRLLVELKSSKIDVFNFESGKKVKTLQLLRGNESGRDSTYARIGTYLKTEKDVKGANVVKRILGNLLIVDSLSSTEQLLTVGHYGDQMIRFIAVTNVLSAVLTFSSLLIAELAEGPYSCVYYYYTGSQQTGYTATYRTPLLRQVIDDYEYNLLKAKVKFDYKGYLSTADATYALYQWRKSKAVEILKFVK